MPTSQRAGDSLVLTTLPVREAARPRPARALAAFARRKPLGFIGGAMLLALGAAAILGPIIAPFDPYEVHIAYKYADPGTIYEATGQRFWLGADQLGRDTLSRLIYGARVSLYVSLVSVGVGVTLGAFIGIVSAFFGGPVDLVVQRAVDSLMAFPAIILALAIVAMAGVSLRTVDRKSTRLNSSHLG